MNGDLLLEACAGEISTATRLRAARKGRAMITVFTLPLRTTGGDLLFTFEKRMMLPMIPDGKVVSVGDHEFPACGYLDTDKWEHCILLGGDRHWGEAEAVTFADHLREKGWECVWQKQEGSVQ